MVIGFLLFAMLDPGSALMLLENGKTVKVRTEGAADIRTGRKIDAKTNFRLASVSKQFTATAILLLAKDGRLSLDDPAARHLAPLPAWAAGITVRHLLTHTSGLGYDVWNADLKRATDALGLPGRPTNIDELARFPLLSDPGTRWNYSISTDVVGHAVEAASGMRLDAYLAAHVTGPLGMADTTFTLSDAQRPRLVAVHQRQADGSLGAGQRPAGNGPGFLAGGGGLVGTAGDYIRFLRMLLRGGALDGARILKAETVRALSEVQTGPLKAGVFKTANGALTMDFDLYPDMLTGHGLASVVTPEATKEGRSPGALAWAGLFNTYYWADPEAGRAGVLMTQLMPFGDPDVLALLRALEKGA